MTGPDLSVTVDGMTLPNPFVIGSGPPGTNYTVRACDTRLAYLGRAAAKRGAAFEDAGVAAPKRSVLLGYVARLGRAF